MEEVPKLHHVSGWILAVQRPSGMLDRPLELDCELAQAVGGAVQRAGAHGEREVDVAAALVSELLLAGCPQAEPRPRPACQPGPVTVAREHLQS
jgi:hypothetical protein